MSLTEQDPYNNVIRTAYRGDGGGAGRHAVAAHQLASTRRSRCRRATSARIARNTQLILQHETGVTKVVDPLAGSYYVERLTASLIAEARKLIDEVEALGGMTKAVEAGMPKLRIEEARRAARRASTAARKSSSASTSSSSKEEHADRHPRRRQRQGARVAGQRA